MKALIIDLSRNNEIKILNTKISSTVQIISGYYLSYRAEDDPLRVVSEKLQNENLSDIPAYIIPPGDLVEKHIFQLPKMPDKEIKKVLPRQIAESKDTSDVMVINYMKNGIVEDRQGEKQEISAFFCAKDKMFDFLNRLKAEGIQPLKIVPEAQGLKTLIEINPQLHSERSGVVLLDLMASRINLNIYRDIYWGLERDFLFRMEAGENLDDEDFTRISTELNRTFQYFKQRNRSYTIENVLVYGSSPDIEHLKNLINDNLPVPASVVTTDFFKGRITLPQHLKDSGEFISIFTLAISTAIAVSTKKYLDVFPTEFKEKSRVFSRVLGLTISAIIIAVILIVSTFYFQDIKKSYDEDIKQIQKTFSSMSTNAAIIDNTKRERVNFYKRRYFIDFPGQYSFSAANFVRTLGLISPPHIELKELEITPGSQTFHFVLTGRIKAENNTDAQVKFLEFFQSLKEFEEILRVDSSNVNVNAGDEKDLNISQDTKHPEKALQKAQLFFTFNGEVEIR